MGMAEQNMMSFAGGLAREGFRPHIHTFGVFITRRPFDQVAMSIGVPNLPVRMLGFLPGLTTPGGVTHQAIDDVALMRSIPNMRILECCDATEVESVLDVAESIDGPMYVRMLRGEVPRFFPTTSPMVFAKPRLLSKGNDVAIITSGICTEEAIRAIKYLKEHDVQISHLHLSTIVPFPTKAVTALAQYVHHGVITMENHSVVGGIGSLVSEVLAEHGIGKKLLRLGVRGYAHGASRPYLLEEFGIDARALIRAVGTLTGREFSVQDVPPLSCVGSSSEGTQHNEDVNKEDRPEDL
jgi:transketolase